MYGKAAHHKVITRTSSAIAPLQCTCSCTSCTCLVICPSQLSCAGSSVGRTCTQGCIQEVALRFPRLEFPPELGQTTCTNEYHHKKSGLYLGGETRVCFPPKINNGNYTGVALLLITLQVLGSLVVLLKYMMWVLKANAGL